MVEHLAYTERVGGSSPSPPTKLFARLFTLVLSVFVGLLCAVPVAAFADPMSFRLVDLRLGQCSGPCPQAVVAEGVIEPDTPDAFLSFAKTTSGTSRLRSVVFLNSLGGNVVASMELGAIFRKLHVAAIVAHFEAADAGTPLTGECISACVYALMGGVLRVAPPGSRVGLHRMSIVEHGFFTTTRSFADPQLVQVLTHYAQRMGVRGGLVKLAESLDPDVVHLLTRQEMARWRLATAQFQ